MGPALLRPIRGTALLVVDVINHFEFDGGQALLRETFEIVAPLGRLLRRARRAGMPVIYANDDFGRWPTEYELLAHLRERGDPVRRILEALAPTAGDHWVSKPRHSAFYRTLLEGTLERLGTEHLIVTGIAADSCVLATAFEAHMRDLTLEVPSDCVAAQSRRQALVALELMQRTLQAGIGPSADLHWPKTRSRATLRAGSRQGRTSPPYAATR